MMAWVMANWTLIASIGWGLCETLALIPAVKSNSVFTLIYNLLASLKPASKPELK